MKYIFLLGVAVLLDFFQFLFFWVFFALQAITPVGGGVAGALAAGGVCYSASGNIISGAFNAAQCAIAGAFAGAGLSAFAIPLGMIVDTTLSITVGGALIVLLAFHKVFYFDIVVPNFLGEVMPVFNFLPFWTIMTWRCIKQKNQEEKGQTSRKTMIGSALTLVTASTGAGGLTDKAMGMAVKRFEPAFNRQSRQEQARKTEGARTPLLPQRFSDGIRPAAKSAAVIALLLLFTGSAHAQALPSPIQYTVTPETPGPKQTVLIEADGVGSFLGSATITWTIDGKVAKTGVGESKLTLTTGALGTKTTVRVSIDSSQGTFTRTFTLSPSLVNLVWEADTTVPPLYRGKALYSAGSDLKVVAFPSVYSGASRIAQSALSYQWSRRDSVVPDQSGLGRFTFSFSGDQLQPSEQVSVDVYYGTAKVGRGEIAIPAVDPAVVLYPRDALRGTVYDTAIPAAINLVGKELTVEARPIYFSNAALKSGQLSFAWLLNDTETTGPDSAKGLLTLRQTGSGQGSATLGVTVQNNDSAQFVQSAQAALQLVFGTQSTGSFLNFFGL